MTWLPWILLGLATWLLLSMPLAILLGSAIRKAEYGELGQGVTPLTGRISPIATNCSTAYGSYHPSRVEDRDRAPRPAVDASATRTSIFGYAPLSISSPRCPRQHSDQHGRGDGAQSATGRNSRRGGGN
jgi:hypothetical protein